MSFNLEFLDVRMAFWGIDVKRKIQQTFIRVRIEITKIHDSNITAAIIIFTGVTIVKNRAAYSKQLLIDLFDLHAIK